MRIELPVSGAMSELLFLGVALILEQGGAVPAGPAAIEIDEELFRKKLPPIIESVLKHVSGKVEASPGSKVGGNDRRSFKEAYLTVFNAEMPDGITYPALFRDAARRVATLIRDGKLDPIKSLESVGKDQLGYEGTFIQPSIIKQMEFYERSTDFLRPTTGPKSMIELDPFWFALLSMGFLWGYSGYYGGAYYLVTYPRIEAELDDHTTILGTIDAVSNANIRRRRRLDKEEVYELGLSLEIGASAESDRAVRGLRWPLRLYKEAVVGQAYTAEKSMDLNLHDLIDFSVRYIKSWRNMDRKLTVKLGDEEVSPMEALVALAERELSSRRGVSGDNEMAAYLLVKDLHRAISAGRMRLVEEALYRAARKSRGIRGPDGSPNNKVDKQLSYVLYAFFREGHLRALLEAIE